MQNVHHIAPVQQANKITLVNICGEKIPLSIHCVGQTAVNVFTGCAGQGSRVTMFSTNEKSSVDMLVTYDLCL